MNDEKTYGFTESKSKREVYTKEVTDNLINNFKTESGEKYIKFENGTLIQWGRANTEAKRQGDILITLPVSFADANYSVSVSTTRNGSILEGIWVADESANQAKTQKNFRIGYLVKSGQSYYNVGVDWIAIGRWK